MAEPVGLLHIGAMSGLITKVEFDHIRMVITAEIPRGSGGHVAGQARIAGMDGSEVWRGTVLHDYGHKPAQAAWTITADIDITRRDGDLEVTNE